MSAAQQEVLDQDLSDQTGELGAVDATQEDAFWGRTYRRERYYTPGLDYEDYAPAYCVGYIGHLRRCREVPVRQLGAHQGRLAAVDGRCAHGDARRMGAHGGAAGA